MSLSTIFGFLYLPFKAGFRFPLFTSKSVVVVVCTFSVKSIRIFGTTTLRQTMFGQPDSLPTHDKSYGAPMRLLFVNFKLCDQKKSPNVYKSCQKMISLEKG